MPPNDADAALRPISADSHAVEGPEVFQGLAERFGDEAPRVVHREGRGDHIVIPASKRRNHSSSTMRMTLSALP